MTMRQMQNAEFFEALNEYRQALSGGHSLQIITASMLVHRCATTTTHRRMARKIFRETKKNTCAHSAV